MTKIFKVYSKHTKSLESDSIFSVIGNNEVDLTKSIAALLYHDNSFLEMFLKLIGKKLNNVDSTIRIYTEQYADGGNKKIRRDITINIQNRENENVLIVVEAKNPFFKEKKTVRISDQLKLYFNPKLYVDVKSATTRIAVTLTKDRVYINKDRNWFDDFYSITWEDLFREMEYGTFKNTITKSLQVELKRVSFMRTFDQEIFSPPAGDTIKKIQELNIYCCPADRNLQNAIYLMPRIPVNGNHSFLKNIIKENSMQEIKNLTRYQGKGFAVALYPIKSSFITDSDALESIKDWRVKRSVTTWLNGKNERLKVYVLGNPMYLQKPIFTKGQNNAYQGYYALSEVWSGYIPLKKKNTIKKPKKKTRKKII
jgi:hypothetical protein